tara:strand:+ start:4849 stop:5010 length:162 start_codon:yes stop_codon:yes gene_type:complete
VIWISGADWGLLLEEQTIPATIERSGRMTLPTGTPTKNPRAVILQRQGVTFPC